MTPTETGQTAKGEQWRRAADRGKALAGKSTLNRLELTTAGAGATERYKKIVMTSEAVDHLMVDVFIKAHTQQPK